MKDFLVFVQNLPLNIDPVFLKVGFFSVGWYSLMYLIAFLVVFILLLWRIKKGEFFLGKKYDFLFSFLFFSFLGAVIGGRVGYILYDWSYFLKNPLLSFYPFNFESGEWIGIYGMSFHGGLLGAFLAAWSFAQKNKVSFWRLVDFSIPAIPAGYFFGRIGNFLNLELFGKETDLLWGMNFGDGILRHPTQIYEALSEGLLLFLFFWIFRNNKKFRGKFLFFYLIGYAFFRISVDFLRESDGIYGSFLGVFTVSQVFSFLMLFFGILGLFFKSKNDAKIVE